ncbi:MAG: multicopper oxidase domain-containing protein [Crocinitomicaceae bacterium]|nr:multicopper oxidase domain-containing protein [Flavobacteriales bacterium]NQZ34774.1 multicopper oxidase domain-containing protein [Crocinitomicaceae bacterium]
MKNIALILITLFSATQVTAQNKITSEVKGDTTIYRLTIDYKTVNFTGKNIKAMAINNSIPAPTLEFEEGKYAVIYVTNNMDVESSVHWHGLILPNYQDGVPYLNSPPIKPKQTHRFEFPLKQSGTYWYHSHTGLQEQRGVYGAIIIKPKEKTFDYDYDLSIVLSDWTDEKPKSVLKNLKRGNEWYTIKRKITQPLSKTIPNRAFGAQLKLWSKRMPGVDISDIAFDAFLTNGKQKQTYPQYKSGDKVRVRLVNASAATYFWITIGGKAMLISSDGIDVVPVHREKVLHAIAETYDFIITIPESGAVEIRATAQDGSGHISTILGSGTITKALVLPAPNYMEMLKKMGTMKMSNDTKAMQMEEDSGTMKSEGMNHDHQNMKTDTAEIKNMDKGMKMNDEFSYDYLKSPVETVIYSNLPTNEIELNLTGNMLRYIWSLNNKVLSEVDKIKIKRGEKVRITFNNKTMMHHPMHLHGHFFRVLNANGEYSPLKHTVNVPPMGSITIEFDANETGDWFFHCHILYHAKSGMARVFSYGDSRNSKMSSFPLKSLTKKDKTIYSWGEATIASHMVALELMASNTYNQFNLDAAYGWNKNIEIGADYERYLGTYFRAYAGIELENETKNSVDAIETVGRIGVRWLLPFFIESDLNIDTELRPQIGFSTAVPIFPRLELQGMWQMQTDFGWRNDLPSNTDWEQEYTWNIGAEYVLAKYWSLSASYDNRFGIGGGITVRF